MRKLLALLAVAVVGAAGSLLVASPAAAHGYISSPPSRQANCASGAVSGCGDIVYEPQSVEAPKGSMQCNGGGSRFGVLNDTSRNWPAATVGTSVTFNWVLTARHATSTWEYFIGNTRIASFNDGGAQPGATKSHTVSLAGYSGRQTVLARWNVADTVMAFYSCVDVNIGGGGTTPPPTGSCSAAAWNSGTAYVGGTVVKHNSRQWKAKWWTQGETPGSADVWVDQGAC
ncbi:lytic polysaccharide monooxygenase [Actinoplanes sp. G11-F43]|uniref:lytic polysaccharide monooxygenase n=1 Tax=Actinoplanes sp. G11-F43 TaxID=3424130 RepID=UPI003D334301